MSDATKYLTLILDTKVTSAVQGIETVSSKMESMASKVTALFGGMGGLAGIFSFGGAVKVLSDVAKKGDDIADGSKRLEVTTDEYQRLAFAAEQTGAGAGSVEAAFRRMNNVLFGVDEESKNAQHTIGLLGLSIDELNQKSPEQKFAAIAAALKKIGDAKERAALASQIFGKDSQSILPMINEYESLRYKLDEVGGLMSGKSIDAADKFRDAMNELTKSFQSFVADTGIINHLKEVTDELAALKKMKDGFAEKNNVILKDDFLRDARNRQIERTDKLPPDSEERKAAMREGLSNAMETRSYDEMGLGRGISAEDYKKYKEMFKNGATSYSPPVTPEDLNKANADKAAKEAADAKAAQIRADAQALSISQEQVKSIMKTLDGREKEKKAVEDIVGEMQNQIKMQDLIAQGKEKEAFIQNEIYKAQKSHADIPMTDEQRKGIADAPIKMPANERQAFIEGEFDKFNKSRPANTLTPDESKNISGLADQIYTGKSNQATSDALKEMRDQLNLQLLINAGKGKQAFIDEQLAKLAKERGEALTDTLREDPKFKEMSDLSGKLYDSKNGIDVKTETPQVDQLAKIGGYSFGGEMNKSLDVERNSLLKQIAAKVGLPVIQEVLT